MILYKLVDGQALQHKFLAWYGRVQQLAHLCFGEVCCHRNSAVWMEGKGAAFKQNAFGYQRPLNGIKWPTVSGLEPEDGHTGELLHGHE